jgi:hypothetical protein
VRNPDPSLPPPFSRTIMGERKAARRLILKSINGGVKYNMHPNSTLSLSLITDI